MQAYKPLISREQLLIIVNTLASDKSKKDSFLVDFEKELKTFDDFCDTANNVIGTRLTSLWQQIFQNPKTGDENVKLLESLLKVLTQLVELIQNTYQFYDDIYKRYQSHTADFNPFQNIAKKFKFCSMKFNGFICIVSDIYQKIREAQGARLGITPGNIPVNRKFFVRYEELVKFQLELAKYIPVSKSEILSPGDDVLNKYNNESFITTNHEVFFDDPNFRLYNNLILQKDSATKLRIKWTTPSNQRNAEPTTCVLEQKLASSSSQEGQVTEKVDLNWSDVKAYINSTTPAKSLIKTTYTSLSPEQDDRVTSAESIQKHLKKTRVKPNLRTIYSQISYQDKSLTSSSTSPQMSVKVETSTQFIRELPDPGPTRWCRDVSTVKADDLKNNCYLPVAVVSVRYYVHEKKKGSKEIIDEPPAWLMKILEGVKALGPLNFDRYCHGVAKFYLEQKEAAIPLNQSNNSTTIPSSTSSTSAKLIPSWYFCGETHSIGYPASEWYRIDFRNNPLMDQSRRVRVESKRSTMVYSPSDAIIQNIYSNDVDDASEEDSDDSEENVIIVRKHQKDNTDATPTPKTSISSPPPSTLQQLPPSNPSLTSKLPKVSDDDEIPMVEFNRTREDSLLQTMASPGELNTSARDTTKNNNDTDTPIWSGGDASHLTDENDEPTQPEKEYIHDKFMWKLLSLVGIRKNQEVLNPVRVEPKVFFSAERTILQWLSICITLAIGALAYIAFFNEANRAFALSLITFAFIFSLYELLVYYYRRWALQHARIEGFYNDKVGPTIFVLVLAVYFIGGATIQDTVFPDPDLFEYNPLKAKYPGQTSMYGGLIDDFNVFNVTRNYRLQLSTDFLQSDTPTKSLSFLRSKIQRQMPDWKLTGPLNILVFEEKQVFYDTPTTCNLKNMGYALSRHYEPRLATSFSGNHMVFTFHSEDAQLASEADERAVLLLDTATHFVGEDHLFPPQFLHTRQKSTTYTNFPKTTNDARSSFPSFLIWDTLTSDQQLQAVSDTSLTFQVYGNVDMLFGPTGRKAKMFAHIWLENSRPVYGELVVSLYLTNNDYLLKSELSDIKAFFDGLTSASFPTEFDTLRQYNNTGITSYVYQRSTLCV
eukprot:TRINITY_DN4550_c2_g4_i1.p1 TRINITY_DN4550_c2_g4~~TRINITY_DN4550_c2_g4_i1.p1  ORF type:complete len:1104 (-),score=251.36 TRINITY_DN4550_c2_g4_i1:56-3367(-)